MSLNRGFSSASRRDDDRRTSAADKPSQSSENVTDALYAQDLKQACDDVMKWTEGVMTLGDGTRYGIDELSELGFKLVETWRDGKLERGTVILQRVVDDRYEVRVEFNVYNSLLEPFDEEELDDDDPEEDSDDERHHHDDGVVGARTDALSWGSSAAEFPIRYDVTANGDTALRSNVPHDAAHSLSFVDDESAHMSNFLAASGAPMDVDVDEDALYDDARVVQVSITDLTAGDDAKRVHLECVADSFGELQVRRIGTTHVGDNEHMLADTSVDDLPAPVADWIHALGVNDSLAFAVQELCVEESERDTELVWDTIRSFCAPP